MMSHTLTDIDLRLLSAYLDGELHPADRIPLQELLEHSAEARAWLQQAAELRALSVKAVESTNLSALSLAPSPKLTGSAIIAAAHRKGAVTLSGTLHSPFFLGGT